MKVGEPPGIWSKALGGGSKTLGKAGKQGVLGGQGSGCKSQHQAGGWWNELGDPESKKRH